jgi:hypothetical protein
MIVMLGGMTLSFLSGNLTLFAIGAFILNFGFRGFYNAAILTVT